MANPTTNYGFVLPTSSDLVTDLPADFDVALQGVDTRLKALQPGTTLGDLAYSSATANTNTRLGIGSTGNVLTVSGGVPTWAAPAAGGGITLISTTTFSGSSITLSSISGSYKNLYCQITGVYNSVTYPAIGVRFNSDTGSNYDYNQTGSQNTSTDISNVGSQTEFGFGSGTSNTGASEKASGILNVFNYAQTTDPIIFTSSSRVKQDVNWKAALVVGQYRQSAAITSITFFASSGNFSGGTVKLYGVN